MPNPLLKLTHYGIDRLADPPPLAALHSFVVHGNPLA
jgi:hypothetical protein